MATILCVDDEDSALSLFKETLEPLGHRTIGVRNIDAALTVLGQSSIDLVLSDYRMPGGTGLELLQEIERREIGTPVVMVTGYGSIEHAVAAIKAGAVDYITKPVRSQQLELTVDQALEMVRLRKENEELRQEVQELRTLREVVGDSKELERIVETISLVAPTRATLLLQGESGTGKELLSRTVHDLSDRKDGPFIPINCAALPETLVESILFGHEKGAFTGAVKQVKGAFERADGGTLLLDEISEMRLDLQAKLLRVLQEQEFERVGGTKPVKVDVRIIATTNRDLDQEAQEGRFRQDLFFRLSTVHVRVPPLRERRSDISPLAHHFARKFAAELDRRVDAISPLSIELLEKYDWPGNVRELAHAIERAVILNTEHVLQPRAFETASFGLVAPRGGGVAVERSGSFPSSGPPPEGAQPGTPIELYTLDVREVEQKLIERALEVTDGNRTKAAELLGVSVRTLRTKLNG
jgi:DNA-binding NtrC family response regulator